MSQDHAHARALTRDDQITAFLRAHGYAAATCAPLAQDASFRRYLRVSGGPRPAVLMDAPPPEDVRPFLRIAAHLSALGLSVPEIVAAGADAGLILEEDLGDNLFAALLDRDPAHGALFEVAADALIAIQLAAPPDGLPEWGADQMTQTALGTLFGWWWPAMFGAAAPDAARADIEAALTDMLRPVAAGPRCFVHRDYFAGNLLWLPERSGVRRAGIIDFQGAATGHPAYDLVSLLQDARRDIADDTQRRIVSYYLAQRPDLDPDAFMDAFHACAAQRHLRVACQWVRLALRDGKPQYLAYGPRAWTLLGAALTQPATAALASALDRWIPANRRCNPLGNLLGNPLGASA